MASIKVIKGFVADFDNGGKDGGNVTGLMVTTFTVGDPPVSFWSPLSIGSPIASGDYVAVAGQRSLVHGIGQVALAYRRLGNSGSAHLFNVAFPIMCFLFGALCIFGGLLLEPGGIDIAAMVAGIALGLFGIWRLWCMCTARSMLNNMESVLSTYQHGQ
ncbi:hypothetical protein [Rhodanobacter sp. DHG33]|uniref:hypothetical protein n=1 Tax=Rhodanobacter sp. DHG33 TaxID=2775921 RepID=UPI001784ECF5|nr:hypothetical protein [Rhodanobacter sp. DHG33]MBD8900323.1 hypothetical protein [Rhodanobacter sp. DHG33]